MSAGPQDGSLWTAAVGLLVVLGVRIIDYILPTKHHLPHLPWVSDEHEEDEEDVY